MSLEAKKKNLPSGMTEGREAATGSFELKERVGALDTRGQRCQSGEKERPGARGRFLSPSSVEGGRPQIDSVHGGQHLRGEEEKGAVKDS